MTYASPFPTFATPVLNQLAASLWISLLSTFKITDTLGLMMLEQLAFAHWAAQELGRKQSRDLAHGADPDSPAILRLSRERRAECRLQAQLARQLNQHLRTEHAKSSKLSNTSGPASTKSSMPANSSSAIAAIAHTLPRTVVRATPKIGRNEPCPCQSGRKYKHCCLHQSAVAATSVAA